MGRCVRSGSVGLAGCFVKARRGSRTAERQRNRHKAGGMAKTGMENKKKEKVEKLVRKEEHAAILEHSRSSDAFTANFQIDFSLAFHLPPGLLAELAPP